MEDLLLRNDNNGVAWLTLNCPDNFNALSDAMIARLMEEFECLETDTRIRAIVIKGAGRAFCAGHDLKEMTAARDAKDGGKAAYLDLFKRCGAMMLKIQSLPQPVIAQVHKVAVAAGCQLVASCDMAVAADGTRFGVNGVNIGLFCSTPMVALTRKIGRAAAMELLTTGRLIEAERAERLGLINYAVPEEDLESTVTEMAETIAGKLGKSLKIGKSAFYDQIEMDIADAYAFTGTVMAENLMLEDTKGGIASFFKKEHPKWTQD
ncbi:MAG: enoyl-CoA hydratase [Halocynthiibacter sp.]